MKNPSNRNNLIAFIYLKSTQYFRRMLTIFVTLLLNFTRSLTFKLEKSKLNLNKNKEEKLNFHALTPEVVENNETIDFYINSMQWAVQKNDCYNIAIMGIYGSGKSTIIQSFFNKHDYYSRVMVSLANFEDGKDLGGLEKSVIQQIFYTVKESKLPNSGLKRIKNHSISETHLSYIKLVLTCFLFSIIIYPKTLCFLKLESIYNNHLPEVQFFAILFLLILCFFYFKKYRYLIQKFGVKLNLQNAEISIPHAQNKSIINEYLDELIYFFEKNHRDIVVFEDLDRFKDKGIFSKLRELNFLLNNHEIIKKKGKITFLYAIKDDIFGNNSGAKRTKFFDFILPVISVMNSSNSYAQIKNLLSEDQCEKLSNDFLKGISYYINDLRLLKNICNEFVIYKTLINDIPKIDYSHDNFFAMVIYKNYFPTDFNNLLKDQGELYFILNTEYRKKLCDYYSIEIQKQITEIQKEIENYNESDEGDKAISVLKNRKNSLEKINVLRMPLSELTSKNGLINFNNKVNQSDENQNLHSVFESELIQYLVKNGFLDENYQLYISHYIDGGLTKNDISFVLHVNESRETSINYDFNLTFISEILSRIQLNKFSTPQMLNFSVIDYLIITGSDKLKKDIFQPISQLNQKQTDFIEKYLERGINLNNFFAELVNVNDKVLDRLLNSSISCELISRAILDFLISIPEVKLNTLLKSNLKLSSFISTSGLLLDMLYIEDDKLVQFMSSIKHVKLKNLNYSVEQKRLLTIEKEQLFEVDINNITVLYNTLFISNSNETRTDISPILTLLFENWDSDSLDYLLSSKNFVRTIYFGSKIIHDENEEFLLNLIDIVVESEDDQEESLLNLIFEKTSTIITGLNSISNIEIQKYLIQNNRIKLTWNNLITYQNQQYEENLQDSEIGEDLIKFIESNSINETLDFGLKQFPTIDDDDFLNFKLRILLDSRIDQVTFLKMVNTVDEEFIDQIEISVWNYSQIEILIQTKLINLSIEWVQYLRHEEWDDLIIDLYITRISDLIENYETFSISCSDLSELLISNVTIENKISLFLKYNFTSHNEENKVDQNVLIFSNQYFNQISFNFQQMMPILKFTDSKDQTLSKKFAIKLLKNVRTDSEIKQIILGLNLKEFNSLWNYSSNMQDFQNSKENIEIFNFLTEKGLVGVLKIRKRDGKLLVYKKKQK